MVQEKEKCSHRCRLPPSLREGKVMKAEERGDREGLKLRDFGKMIRGVAMVYNSSFGYDLRTRAEIPRIL